MSESTDIYRGYAGEIDGIGDAPIADFLPSADQRQRSLGDAELKLMLSAESLAIFEREAARRNMRVEDVVRVLLEDYAG